MTYIHSSIRIVHQDVEAAIVLLVDALKERLDVCGGCVIAVDSDALAAALRDLRADADALRPDEHNALTSAAAASSVGNCLFLAPSLCAGARPVT